VGIAGMAAVNFLINNKKLICFALFLEGKAVKLMHLYMTNMLESLNSHRALLVSKHQRYSGTYAARSDCVVLTHNLGPLWVEPFIRDTLKVATPSGLSSLLDSLNHVSEYNRGLKHELVGKRSKLSRGAARRARERSQAEANAAAGNVYKNSSGPWSGPTTWAVDELVSSSSDVDEDSEAAAAKEGNFWEQVGCSG
jgi:hypothetical protein